MTPVMQTPGHHGGGDCLRAAIASVLDMWLDNVPDFIFPEPGCKPNERWLASLFRWCRENHIRVMFANVDGYPWPYVDGALLVAIGPSPRSSDGSRHAVVIETRVGIQPDGELGPDVFWDPIHDPHPDGNFITEIDSLLWLVKE